VVEVAPVALMTREHLTMPVAYPHPSGWVTVVWETVEVYRLVRDDGTVTGLYPIHPATVFRAHTN
jgi:hypothetical protein